MSLHGPSKELTMRSYSSFRPWLPGLLLILATPLAALPAADRRAPTFEGSSQVVSVEVPVNVVGRDGEPVRGLTADDFEVYDGGEKQTVSSFEVVDLKTMTEAAAGPTAPGALPELRPAARRHFLLLFDLSFSTPTSVLRARLAARDFVLTSLHPTDLAAVATYSLETGPKLIVTFTPDRAQLARAIDTLGYHQAIGGVRTDPLHFVIDEPDSALLSLASGSSNDRRETHDLINQEVYEYLKTIARAAQKEERSFQMSRISNYSRSLAEVAKALNSVQGRKQVVFFSEGFDSRLLLGRDDTTDPSAAEDTDNILSGQSYFVDSDQRFGNTSLQGDINRMLDQFRRADCIIQAVDIGGLRAANDEQARPKGEGALFVMANETGGELFKDANNLREPLNRMLERTSVTYLLSFERADLKSDGAYHRLKVKAKLPPGAKLTYRTGYFAPRPFQQLDPLERNLLAGDGIASAAPRRDLDLNVLTAAFRATPERAYVPVIIEANGRSLLAGEKDKKEKKLDVEIYAYVSDGQGRMLDFFNRRVSVDLDKGGARRGMEEGGVKYYGHFDLAPGTYHVRVLVRNAGSGRTGVQTVAVSVPSYSQAQPVLLPPFFMEDNQKWLLVREQTGGELKGSVVYPFTVSGEPYVPAARPVLKGEKPARLCLVAYNLGKGDLAVQGEVLAADGKPAPQTHGKLSRIERTATGIQGLDKLVATFDPAGLSAGDYVLRVAVTDPATGHKQTNSLPFHVVR
jgi:VWFA-related protein